jgi:hypothetical protein
MCLSYAFTNSRFVVGDVCLQLGRCALFQKFCKSLWEIVITMLWENLSAEAEQVADFQNIIIIIYCY